MKHFLHVHLKMSQTKAQLLQSLSKRADHVQSTVLHSIKHFCKCEPLKFAKKISFAVFVPKTWGPDDITYQISVSVLDENTVGDIAGDSGQCALSVYIHNHWLRYIEMLVVLLD